MTTPTAIQLRNRIQVNAVRFSISHTHAPTEATGSHGTHGNHDAQGGISNKGDDK